MKGEVKKTIFTFRSNVFTLLQAMTKNNNVPSIDVGLAIICLFICLFTKKLGNFKSLLCEFD